MRRRNRRGFTIGLLALALLLGLTALSCSRTRSSSKDLDITEGPPFAAEDLTFVDMEALRGDEDMEFLLTAIEDVMDISLASVGAMGTNVSRAVTYVIGEERVVILQGDIGKEKEVRGSLSDSGYLSEDFRGVEVWSGEGPIGAVALLESDRIILSGDAREVSLTVTDLVDERYLGSRIGMSLILVDLPDGMVMSLTTNCQFAAEGCSALGISFSKKDATLSSFNMVALFPTDSEATSGQEQLDSLFTQLRTIYPTVETKVVGRRILVAGDAVSENILGGLSQEFVLAP